jgi:hypothetical protein
VDTGRSGGAPRRRVLALVPFRDEMRFLPGFFANVAPHVDGIVALDDGSTDGSGTYAASQPPVLELLTIEPGAHGENEDAILRRRLVEAAWEHGADWLLGIDADERLETGFRERMERELDRADETGADALWVPFKELYAPDRVRVDGVWGTKHKACLFRSSRDHVFDERRMHGRWASLREPEASWPAADLRLYHLRMIEPADRVARAELYRRLDPDRRWQPIGYDYLLDEDGMELAPLEPGRGYAPSPSSGGAARRWAWRARRRGGSGASR